MPERVGQHGDLAVGGGANAVFDDSPDLEGAGEGGLYVVDRDVQMHRRPMTVIGSELRAGADRTGLLAQQIDR